GVPDRDVAELGRVVDAEVVRDPLIRGIEQDEPDFLAVRSTLVQRQTHALLAEVNLDRALHGEVISWEESGQLTEPLCRGRGIFRSRERLAPHYRREGDDRERDCSEQPPLREDFHSVLL